MSAEHAFSGGAQLGDGRLGAKVAVVGLELDPVERQGLEGVAHQGELAGRIDLGAPDRRRVPGMADLQAPVRRLDGEVAGASDQAIVGQAPHRPDRFSAVQRQVERLVEPGGEPIPRRGVRHVVPDLVVVRGKGEGGAVGFGQRLQPHGASGQDGSEIGEGEHCRGGPWIHLD